jgi:N-acylglucosamine 2-epimerase
LAEIETLYRKTLLDDVIPFWMNRLDPRGGIDTCLDDDGRVVSRDRWGWSQWRAVWVFSKLFNAIEPRPEWKDAAWRIYEFVSAHPLADGHWPLLLDGDGNVKRGYESIATDGFALYGLVELWRATREPRVLELARRTFRAMEESLRKDDPLPTWPYPTPSGSIAQGVSMCASLFYHELAEATGDAEAREAAFLHHRRVMDVFWRPNRNLILERLRRDGSELPPPQGTTVVLGHAIESLWFQMQVARDRETILRAAAGIKRHLEVGWDAEYGGLLLAIDADGRSDVDWKFADSKLWWPHTEALYATLLAYEHTREAWCLEWHERIREYSFRNYPDPRGEWRQKLDRRGRPISDVVALPVKDPFHLPRALIYCIKTLERLSAKGVK